MHDQSTGFRHTRTPRIGSIRRRFGYFVLSCWLLPACAAYAQNADETVRFISDMTNTHGFVRALSCRNPKAGKPTKVTEVYSVIPTGAKFGAVELNHGRDDVNTGFTHFDLHDIERIEYQGQESRENNLVLYGVRFTCKGDSPCILKTSFCTGAVTDLEAQFPHDVLLFRSASYAERTAKAFAHMLTLVGAQQNTQPF